MSKPKRIQKSNLAHFGQKSSKPANSRSGYELLRNDKLQDWICRRTSLNSVLFHVIYTIVLASEADTHFALQNTLLLGTLCRLILCSSEHFAPQHILIPGTLCFLKHFAPQHILLPGTLCSLEHFAPWNILLLCIMFSATYFALWNTKSKLFKEAKCYWEQSVLRSKMCQGSKVHQATLK